MAGENKILFDGATARFSNTIMTVSVKIDPISEEKFAISGSRMLSSLSTFSSEEEINLKVKDSVASFSSGNTKRTMSLYADIDVTKMEVDGPVRTFAFSKDVCDSQKFVTALKRAKIFSGSEKVNRDLVFANFSSEGISVYSTDHYLFYMEKIPAVCNTEFSLALTPEHCKLIFDMLETGNSAVIGLDRKGRIAVKTLFGYAVATGSSSEHANYLALIDKFAINSSLVPKISSTKFSIKIADLKESVSRCSKVFTSEHDYERPLKITCEPGKAKLYASSTKNNDTIQDFIQCSDISYESRFYIHNLQKALTVCDSKSEFYFTTGVSHNKQPLCILSESSCVYVGPITE